LHCFALSPYRLVLACPARLFWLWGWRWRNVGGIVAESFRRPRLFVELSFLFRFALGERKIAALRFLECHPVGTHFT